MSGYSFYYTDQDGNTYTLTDNVRTFLHVDGMHGFGIPRLDVSVERRPYRDGGLLLGRVYMPPREVQLALVARHDSYADLDSLVRSLRRVVNPYKDPETLGTLRVVRPDGEVRCLDCWLTEWQEPEEASPVYGVHVLTFYAPSPAFYNPTVNEVSFQLSSGGLVFPVTFPITFVPTSIDTYLYPNNKGDMETWPTFVIYGPGTNPAIENETVGATMAITQVLDTGDTITIDMDSCTVTWYDASAGTSTSIIQNISDTSRFYPLTRGENVLHFTMGNAVSGSVVCRFYERYIVV